MPRACSTALSAPSALGDRSRIVRDCPRTGPGRLLAGSQLLLARPRCSKIGPAAFFWRPGSILSASRCVSETALSAQNRPRSILHRFSMDLGSIFVDFRKIFRRISLDPPVTKAQIGISKRSRVILTARLGPCEVQSLRVARTPFEMTFGHYIFSLFSLRTYKCT